MKILIPAFVGCGLQMVYRCLEWLGVDDPTIVCMLPRAIKVREVYSYEPEEVIQVKTFQPGFYVTFEVDKDSIQFGNLYRFRKFRIVFTRDKGRHRLVIQLTGDEVHAIIGRLSSADSVVFSELADRWPPKVREYFSEKAF